MAVNESDLHDILGIGHETSMRGKGISLRAALRKTRYKDLRAVFGAQDLLPIIDKHQSLVDEWIAYSQDKRTPAGWGLYEGGVIGRINAPDSQIRFRSLNEAVSEYVVRELDYWAEIDNQ